MYVYNLEDYTLLPRKYNRDGDVIRIWEGRLSRKIRETKSITKRLEYEVAIMNVKYPFLEASQRRGRALSKMNIPSFMGKIPNLRIYHLASPGSKTDIIQMASEVHTEKNNAKQYPKSRPKHDIITKEVGFSVQIYEDPGESNGDCDQSQRSQSPCLELYSICKDIQNIPPELGRKLMISNLSTSPVTEIKPKESSQNVRKRNIKKSINKRSRVRKQIPRAMHSTPDTIGQRNMDTQGNENIAVKSGVMKAKLFFTSVCKAKKCQENRTIKDSKSEENEEDIQLSEVNTEIKCIQQRWQIESNNFTLGTDLLSTTTEANRAHNGESADYSDYIPSSAPSSPLHCNDKSILQTDSRLNVLPQNSPLQYVLLDTYSSSQESNTDTEDAKTASGGEEACSHTLQKQDTLLPNMCDPLAIKDEDTVRSISPFCKTSGSGSDSYIILTTQKTDDTVLSDDYGTPARNTNSSDDADFLADMFDRTAQVYRHHLRAVANPDLITDNCRTALDI